MVVYLPLLSSIVKIKNVLSPLMISLIVIFGHRKMCFTILLDIVHWSQYLLTCRLSIENKKSFCQFDILNIHLMYTINSCGLHLNLYNN